MRTHWLGWILIPFIRTKHFTQKVWPRGSCRSKIRRMNVLLSETIIVALNISRAYENILPLNSRKYCCIWWKVARQPRLLNSCSTEMVQMQQPKDVQLTFNFVRLKLSEETVPSYKRYKKSSLTIIFLFCTSNISEPFSLWNFEGLHSTCEIQISQDILISSAIIEPRQIKHNSVFLRSVEALVSGLFCDPVVEFFGRYTESWMKWWESL